MALNITKSPTHGNIPVISNGTKHPFPSDFVSPKTKELDEYGLISAKAIYYTSQQFGPALFYNDRIAYQEYINYAIGENSEDKYKPLLRISPDQSSTTWVGAMRWAIKNYATKRLNIVVSKVSERVFDPQVEPLDQNAKDDKEAFKQRVKFYMDFKEQNDAFGAAIRQSMLPEGVSEDMLPEGTDQLDQWTQANYKYYQGAAMEKLIIHHMDRNRYMNHKRASAFNTFALGAGIIYVGMDENMLPECYNVSPEDMIVPPTDREDFSDANYQAQIMRPTVGEFYKMVGSSRPKEWVEKVVEKHGTIDPGAHHFGRQHDRRRSRHDEARVEVMRFVRKTTNEMVHIEKEDVNGNPSMHKADYDDYKTEAEQKKFKEKYPDRNLRRDKYNTIYEGFWVTGSENYIFRYGERTNIERHRGNLSETPMPFKMFAPNIKNNRLVSTIKQMVPVLDELQSYHVKKQHILANALPAVWDIDLNALRNADFKWNNKDMTDQDKIEFLFQSGIFLRDSGDRHLPGNNYQPIRNLANSVANDVMMYVSLIQQTLIELDEIIGMNKVSSASSLRPDTLKGTAEIQAESSEVALDYLYRADRELTLEVIKSLGVLSRQSAKYKEGDYYEKIISKQELELIRNSSYSDHGYKASLRPTAMEWQRLYADAMDALRAEKIEWDDYLDLKTYTTLKDAQAAFKVAIRKRRKEAQQLEQNKISSTVEGQQASNNQTHKNAMQLAEFNAMMEAKKDEREAKLEAKRHSWKMAEIKEEVQLITGKDLVVQEQKGRDQAKNTLVNNLTSKNEEKKPKVAQKK